MSLYVSARKYGPQVCDGCMILSLALPSILSSFCKEIWTLGVSWLQTSANFLETVFGQWVGQWVGHWTIFTSPAFSVEYGGAGNGGYGVTHLLRTFDPPPNVNLPGLGFGGSNILYTEPSPSGKNTKGSKLLHFLNVHAKIHHITPRKGWWSYRCTSGFASRLAFASASLMSDSSRGDISEPSAFT